MPHAVTKKRTRRDRDRGSAATCRVRVAASKVIMSTAKGDTMPNTAIKIRKTKSGLGTIYKLEPAMVVESGVVEYVIYECVSGSPTYGGMVSPVKVTTIVACVPSETGYNTKRALFSRRYDGKKLSAQKAFEQIGYAS